MNFIRKYIQTYLMYDSLYINYILAYDHLALIEQKVHIILI
ncbi:hypothetical protein QOZ95_004469 [Paenibacillus brasilensis]|uniref:Uncharacterized protein n=1 Tax=Paenibacillus brasilensis TaxID=128574 RepID=A0ABU0L4R6_9BACL|nr:hypothetical protein [Paenibacillus brasilensis]